MCARVSCMHFLSVFISFIRLARIYIKGCWSPKANSMIEKIKWKATSLNRHHTKCGLCKWNSCLLYWHTVPISNDLNNFLKSTYNPPNKYLSPNRTESPLKVDNKHVGSGEWLCVLEDFPLLYCCLHFLIHHSGKAIWHWIL